MNLVKMEYRMLKVLVLSLLHDIPIIHLRAINLSIRKMRLWMRLALQTERETEQ